VVHGESDDVVPLSAVLDWARPQVLPVTVVPGTGHFFHGQLPLLKQIVQRLARPLPFPRILMNRLIPEVPGPAAGLPCGCRARAGAATARGRGAPVHPAGPDRANQVLAEREADAQADPASLTKLMTAYLVFNALRDKKLTLEQTLPVSQRAWAERKGGGSLMFIDTTMTPKVDELLRA
jgi:hypothetical protein